MSVPQLGAEQRGEQILAVFDTAFGELLAADPAAFRVKFRKMAASPFAFYRGTACLFYADLDGGAARRPVPGRAHQPGVDPRRPARRELRHVHGRQRPAGLQRQRLRRGVRRPLHLGPQALRRLRRAASGTPRRSATTQITELVHGLRGRLPRAHPRAGHRREERRGAALHPGHRRGPAAGRAARRPLADPRRRCSTR